MMLKSLSSRTIVVTTCLVIILFTKTVSAALVSHRTGESNNIQFQWGVSNSTPNSGASNVYFQLSAPKTYSWVGLGIGSGMRNAQMFLLYQDGNGNITLSTREGRGHIMPLHTQRNDVELLDGSGLVNGSMVANVRCSDCSSLDLGGSNGRVAAWKSGEPLDTASLDAPIQEHDGHTLFRVDFAQASVRSDTNPFSGDEASGDEGSSGGSAVDESDEGASLSLQRSHGIVMSIVFIGLYPLGSSLMPLFGTWYIHAMWQAIAYLLMWAGLGLGVVLANEDSELFNNTHTIMGVTVVSLLGIQPIFGWFHHADYRKNGKAGVLSYIHVWTGRILMILGVINGGLGLQLAGDTTGAFIIAYCVITGVVALVYLASVAFGHFRRRKLTQGGADSPKPETQRVA